MKKVFLSTILVFIGFFVFSQEVIHLDAKTFKEKVWDYDKDANWKYKGDVPAIIDFYADWCRPCKALSPKLAELQKEYGNKIQVYKINTDRDGQVARLFGIRSIPTLIFAPVKGQYSQAVGNIPKDQLKAEIKKTLKVE